MNSYSSEILTELTKQIHNKTLRLASQPDIILKINAILDNSNAALLDIVKVIQSDISLSLRLIQISNSPGIRHDRKITSVTDAVSILGVSIVKNLALCVSFKDKFSSRDILHSQLLATEIQTSISRSIYGYMIAKYVVNLPSPDTALVAGLISLVGNIVLLRYLGDNEKCTFLTDTEVLQILDDIGNQVTSSILIIWDLPTDITKTVLGSAHWNSGYPATYRDSFMLTDEYLKYKAGSEKCSDLCKYIDVTLVKHQEELDSLKTIFG